MFNPSYSSMNQELFEKHLSNKVATIKIMDDLRYAKETITCTTKLIPFTVSKDEWNTKEATGESMNP